SSRPGTSFPSWRVKTLAAETPGAETRSAATVHSERQAATALPLIGVRFSLALRRSSESGAAIPVVEPAETPGPADAGRWAGLRSRSRVRGGRDVPGSHLVEEEGRDVRRGVPRLLAPETRTDRPRR